MIAPEDVYRFAIGQRLLQQPEQFQHDRIEMPVHQFRAPLRRIRDLGAKLGDEVEITYFEPESTHGQVRESRARFRLKEVVDLAGLAADPNLTPQLPGVTDQLSIGDWDPPFPFVQSRVRDQDEAYWDDREATEKFGRPMYRTTPKAFVSLAAGRNPCSIWLSSCRRCSVYQSMTATARSSLLRKW